MATRFSPSGWLLASGPRKNARARATARPAAPNSASRRAMSAPDRRGAVGEGGEPPGEVPGTVDEVGTDGEHRAHGEGGDERLAQADQQVDADHGAGHPGERRPACAPDGVLGRE